MNSQINCQGIYDSAKLNRRIAILEVNYQDEVYNWEIDIPPAADLSEYLSQCHARVESEIDEKLAVWQALDPKTQTTVDPLTGETLTIDIDKKSVVRSDVESRVLSVTPRQARLALLTAGLLDQVVAKIELLPEPQRTAAKIEWEYAIEIVRDSSLVQALAQALDLSDSQLNQLFQSAATF